MKKLIYTTLILVFFSQVFSCKLEDHFLEKSLGSDVNVDSIFSSKQKSLSAIAQA